MDTSMRLPTLDIIEFNSFMVFDVFLHVIDILDLTHISIKDNTSFCAVDSDYPVHHKKQSSEMLRLYTSIRISIFLRRL